MKPPDATVTVGVVVVVTPLEPTSVTINLAPEGTTNAGSIEMVISTDVAALAELRVMVGFAAPRPADNATEGEESAEVCTVTPFDEVTGMEPTVTPVIVTVTTVLTAIDAAVVITKQLQPLGCWETDAALTSLTTAVGGVASAETKNPAGYISVMELPDARAPPAVVANANVTIAAVFPTVRSDADMVK